MDPLMRKLFQPREAREKLRGMGGIMSSSPQLASTVAKFQQGGPIQAMAPERVDLGGAMPLASAIHGPSGMMYGQMSLQQLSALANSGDRLAAEVLMMLQPPADARTAPQSVSDVTRALEEFYPGSGYADVMRGGPRMPPDLSDKSGGDFTNFITDSLGNAAQLGTMLFPGARLPASEIIEAAPEIQDRDAQRAEIEAQLADQNLSEFEREALEARLLGLSGEGFIADAGSMVIDSLGRIISAPGRIAGAGLSAIGATDAGAALLEAYDAGYYDSESPRYRNASQPADSGAPAPAETPEDEARRMLLRQDRRAATPVDEADADPVADPETTPDDNQDAPLENLDPNDPDTFDTTYDKMLTRLQSVMGTKDEDSRQKAMANLAMIGLAIAAGQSPDALTNIAQGALTGVKAIREDQAAAKEQDKALRMAALTAALNMEQGTRTTEATAARDERKFQNDLELEREKARLGVGGGSAFNRAELPIEVYTTALNENRKSTTLDVPEGLETEAYAKRLAAEQALTQIQGLIAAGRLTEAAAAEQIKLYEGIRDSTLTPAELEASILGS